MKMKKILFALSLVTVALSTVACEEDILRDTDEAFVTLNGTNTYLAGKEVRFQLHGSPDYVYFFSGEVGSQYEYRDRTTISMEDLETCKLVVETTAVYGLAGALDLYASKSFTGLKGDDGAADFATMKAVQATMDPATKEIPGWEKLPYKEVANTPTAQEYDITDYADSFCLAFHWNTPACDQTQRTYRINLSVKTKFRGYDEVTTPAGSLGLISVSMNSDYIADPYYHDKSNGSVRFLDPNYDIIMQGVGANVLPYCLDSWVVTTPRPLNNIAPDKGISIKNFSDDTSEYGYIYEKPGSYEATFMITNANYQGSHRKVQHMKINIVEPISAE